MMILTDEVIAELKRDLPEWEATEEMFRERHNDGLTGAEPHFTPGPTYEALTARVALLEEALRPFAEAERAFSEGQVSAALKHLAGSDFARAAGALGTAQTKETGR